MNDEEQKVKLEYLLKITRNLYDRGLNETERAGIIVLISRLINLENEELRNQYLNELKNLEGENNMAEMNWIQEYFYNEAINAGRSEGFSEGIAVGEARGEERERSEALNAAIDFMRLNGMSSEKISNFRNSMFIN